MKLTSNQKTKLLANIMKGVGLIGFTSILGFLIYNVFTAQQRGRERALQREQIKGKKKPHSILAQELQPEYIEKQRRKYKSYIQNKSTS